LQPWRKRLLSRRLSWLTSPSPHPMWKECGVTCSRAGYLFPKWSPPSRVERGGSKSKTPKATGFDSSRHPRRINRSPGQSPRKLFTPDFSCTIVPRKTSSIEKSSVSRRIAPPAARLDCNDWQQETDGQRRKMATQRLRSKRNAGRADGVYAKGKAVLLGIHRAPPTGSEVTRESNK